MFIMISGYISYVEAQQHPSHDAWEQKLGQVFLEASLNKRRGGGTHDFNSHCRLNGLQIIEDGLLSLPRLMGSNDGFSKIIANVLLR